MPARRSWFLYALKFTRDASYCWVGVYWKRVVDLGRTDKPFQLHLYICALPCLPVIVVLERRSRLKNNQPKSKG